MEGFKVNRVICIEVQIIEPAKAEWIWRNHMKGDTGHGVLVTGIREGKIPEEREEEDE